MASTRFEGLARKKAGLFAGLLGELTGREYVVDPKHRQVIIRAADYHGPELRFSGTRWEDVFQSVADAWRALETIDELRKGAESC